MTKGISLMSTATNKKTTQRWIVLAFAYLALLGALIVLLGWTPALEPIRAELSLDYGSMGLLGSVSSLAAGVALFVGGVLADARFGAKRVVLTGLALGVIGQFIFAAANGFGLALTSRVVAGLGIGLMLSGCITLALKWFEGSKRYGTASAVMITSDGLGGLLALYGFAFFLTGFGWRTALNISGVVLLALLIASFFVLEDAPKAIDSEPSDIPERGTLGASLRRAMSRNLLVGMIWTIGIYGLFTLIGTWAPTILIEGGRSPEAAGLLTAFMPVGGAIGALLMGLWVDRAPRKKLLLILASVTATVVILLETIAVGTGNLDLFAVLLPIQGMVMYAGIPVVFALAVAPAGAQSAGIITGVTLGAGYIIGGFVYPILIGTVRDNSGEFTTGFLIVTVITAVLFSSSLFAKNPRASVNDAGAATEPRMESAATID